jgi:hypothetical protein
MKLIKRKKCRHCNRLFTPDPRNATRQKYCNASECRKASKADSQMRWLKKPENVDYFHGTANVQRVQEWRKKHPGYWRRKSKDALQETLNPQPMEIKGEGPQLISHALQDLLTAQPIVLLGLIANFTGTRLQDHIAISVRRLLQLGQDILNNSNNEKGGPYGNRQTAHLFKTGAANTQTVQLDRSPPG